MTLYELISHNVPYILCENKFKIPFPKNSHFYLIINQENRKKDTKHPANNSTYTVLHYGILQIQVVVLRKQNSQHTSKI